jgi:hypothetical protein
MTDIKEAPQLNKEEIQEGIDKRLEKYKNLSFLEHYAMYMGVAQILEFGLKKLLEIKFNYDLEKMETWTLGKTKAELEKCGLRKDFITLLENVVISRNYIAHEILVNESLMNGILRELQIEGEFSKNDRFLTKSIYELEYLILFFDWINENNGWD